MLLVKDKEVNRRYSKLYEDLNVKSGARVFLWPGFFLARRILLAFIIISIDKIFFQIFLTWLQLIIALVILGNRGLFLDKSRLNMEYFNEVIMMWVLMTMFYFTPWVDDVILKIYVGFVSCGLIILHFTISLVIIFVKNFKELRKKCRRRRFRKHKEK